MARKVRFERDHKQIREQLLMGNGAPNIQGALVGIANGAKPAGTEVFVAHSYGPKGRMVVHIIDRSADEAFKESAAERRSKRQALQQALNRVGGRFRKGGGQKL